MNFMCLYCEEIRTGARPRGGGAIAVFRCDQSGQERVYLLPGEPMACFCRREGDHAEQTSEKHTNEGTDGHR